MTKEQFVRILNLIKEYDEKLDVLFEANRTIAMGIVEHYDLKDAIIETLEYAMNVKTDPNYGSDISWWVFETEYGKKNPYVYIKGRKYSITTPEKLYNLIKKGDKYGK